MQHDIVYETNFEFLSYLSAHGVEGTSVKEYIAEHVFLGYAIRAAEVVLFLLAVMTIVEVLNNNGCFDFILPVTQDKIKFRFLTHGDIKQIEEIEKEEQNNVKKERLTRIVEELNTFIENDDKLTKDEKIKLYEAKRNINKWSEKIEVDNELGYTHTLTNRLELSIVSINGEEDREYISEYVNNMNVRDALAIRRYISENEPGLDYTVTVERPESLGGGSMPVFLSLDEYVFLNVS